MKNELKESLYLMGSNLNILHVHSICGIPNTLSRLMDMYYNTKSLVMSLKKWDKYGHMSSGEIIDTNIYLYLLWLLIKARSFDIIHLHDRGVYLPYLRALYPNKKFIMHYHGSSIRDRWIEKFKEYRHADMILVSTKDLMINAPDNVHLLLNPVDINMFKISTLQIEGTALSRHYGADKEVKLYAEEYDLELTFMPDFVNYKVMPYLLSNYEYFIDIKRSKLTNEILYRNGVLSMTGLQALSTGCKVIDSDGVIHEGLPVEHTPNYAVTMLYAYYQNMILGD